MKPCWRIIVSGRVQGVSYRAHARQQAHALALAGHVRNLPGGEVEIIAQGEAADLERLLAWCHVGPELARVSCVVVEDWRPPEILTGFHILRP